MELHYFKIFLKASFNSNYVLIPPGETKFLHPLDIGLIKV